LDGTYAPNTLRAFKADMLEFIAYYNKTSNCAFQADPKQYLHFYCKRLAEEQSSHYPKKSLIQKRHSSTVFNRGSNQRKDYQRKVHRQLRTRFNQAYPITRALLRGMLKACRDNHHGLRDRAWLLVAYESMIRRSELIYLHIEDIE